MCGGKTTYLRLYSGDKTSGTNTTPKFILNKNIENIKSFKIIQFVMDCTNITSNFIQLNSPELTAITDDYLQGSYNNCSQTIITLDTLRPDTANLVNSLENPTYECTNGMLNAITLNFLDEGASASAGGMTTQKWSMLIKFNH